MTKLKLEAFSNWH